MVLVFNKNTKTQQIITKKSFELAQKNYKLIQENYTPKEGENGYDESSTQKLSEILASKYAAPEEKQKRTRKKKESVELNSVES